MHGQPATNGAYISHYNRDYDVLTSQGFSKARSTPIPGGLSEGYTYGNRLNGDLFGTVRKTLGSVNLTAILGTNVQVRTAKTINASTAALGVPNLFNLNNSLTGLFAASDSKSEQRKIGNYIDLTAGINNYLYLHAVARHDQSSVFYQTGREGNLYQFLTYGADVSLVLSDLFPSMKTNKILNFAKIRAGWNKNTNDNIGPNSLELIYTNAPGFPYSGLLGTGVSNTLIDPNLTAETVKASEIGVELGFLKNRISLEATYYNQKADNQILNVQVSSASGYSGYLLNAADVTNKGFDVDLKTQVVKGKDWNVNVNLNYSRNTNVVTRCMLITV